LDFEALKKEKFSFVYITAKDCNVCKVLQPRLKEIAKVYKGSFFYFIELDDHKNAAGFFMAFSVPTFLVYSEGKELIRESRHMNLGEITNKLDRYYEMIFD
jgi:thioredoxin-like negative regulator of GroEL